MAYPFFFFNWAQHASPQNVQATVQEISVCLHPTLHGTQIPVVNAVQGTGLFTLGTSTRGRLSWSIPQGLYFWALGSFVVLLTTKRLHEAKEASDNVKVNASFKVSSRRARMPFIPPVWFETRPKENLGMCIASYASVFLFVLVMKCP